MRLDAKSKRGTGFLIAPNLLVTALHVIADVKNGQVTQLHRNIILQYVIDSEPQPLQHIDQPNICAKNEAQDWVVLIVERSEAKVWQTNGSLSPGDGARWSTFGFPTETGLGMGGEITTMDSPRRVIVGRSFKMIPSIQLFSSQAAQRENARGYSGAPVVFQDIAFGVLCHDAEDDSGENERGVLFACPLSQILTDLHQSDAFREHLPDIPYDAHGDSASVAELSQTSSPTRTGDVRPTVFVAGRDISPEIADAYNQDRFDDVVRMIDEELLKDVDQRSRVALLACKGESLWKMKDDRAIECFFDASREFGQGEIGHWVYRVRAYVIGNHAKAACSTAEQAIRLFPSDIDVWIAHAQASLMTQDPATYIAAVPRERLTPELLDVVLSRLYENVDWDPILDLTQDLKTAEMSDDAVFYRARALIEASNLPPGAQVSPPLEQIIHESLGLFRVVRSRTQLLKSAHDKYLNLESALGEVDCLNVLGRKREGAEVVKSLGAVFAENLAVSRARYLQLLDQGLYDEALQKTAEALDIWSDSHYSRVALDHAHASLAHYQVYKKAETLDTAATIIERGINRIHDEQGVKVLLLEQLCQARLSVFHSLGREEAALAFTRDRIPRFGASPLLALGFQIAQLLRMGKQAEALSIYEAGWDPALTDGQHQTVVTFMAKALTNLRLYEQALELFSRFKLESLSRDEATAKAHCYYRCTEIHGSIDTLEMYQKARGFNLDMTYRLMSILIYRDPIRLITFLKEAPSAILTDWQVFNVVMVVPADFGTDFSVDWDTDVLVDGLLDTVPPAYLAYFARKLLEKFGRDLGIRFALLHVAKHFNYANAKLSFVDFMWSLDPNDGDLQPESAIVYAIRRSDQSPWTYFCSSPPEGLRHLTLVPQEEEQEIINEIGVSPVHRIDVDIHARGMLVRTLPFWLFLGQHLQRQVDALASTSEDGLMRVLSGTSEIESFFEAQSFENTKRLERLEEALGTYRDVYYATSATGVGLVPGAMPEALLMIRKNQQLALSAGPKSTPQAVGTKVLVDVVPFINFVLSVDAPGSWLAQLPCTFYATPRFFQQLSIMKELLDATDEQALGARLVEARSLVHYMPSLSVLSNPVAVIGQAYRVLGVGADTVLTAAQSTGLTLWSDSVLQRGWAAALGVPHVNTGDILDWVGRHGLATDQNLMKVRFAMAASGYAGHEVYEGDIDRILLWIAFDDGPHAVDILVRAFGRPFVDYDRLVALLAQLVRGLFRVQGLYSGSNLSALLSGVRSLSLRWTRMDLRRDVFDSLEKMRAGLGPKEMTLIAGYLGLS